MEGISPGRLPPEPAEPQLLFESLDQGRLGLGLQTAGMFQSVDGSLNLLAGYEPDAMPVGDVLLSSLLPRFASRLLSRYQ